MGPLHAEYEPTYDERAEQRLDLAEHCFWQDSLLTEDETYRCTRRTLDSRPVSAQRRTLPGIGVPPSSVPVTGRLSSASR